MSLNINLGGLDTIRKIGNGYKLTRGFFEDRVSFLERESIVDADLTKEEMLLAIKEEVLASRDSNFVISRLNSFLKILAERDCSSSSILSDFVNDISNWNRYVYMSGKRSCHWRYSLSSNYKEKHHFIELRNGNKKVMVVDATTALNGRLLEFDAMYHVNLAGYALSSMRINGKPNFGTMILNIDCSKRDIIFRNKFYSLDLLGRDKFSEHVLEDNLLEDNYYTLFNHKGRK